MNIPDCNALLLPHFGQELHGLSHCGISLRMCSYYHLKSSCLFEFYPNMVTSHTCAMTTGSLLLLQQTSTPFSQLTICVWNDLGRGPMPSGNWLYFVRCKSNMVVRTRWLPKRGMGMHHRPRSWLVVLWSVLFCSASNADYNRGNCHGLIPHWY